MISKFKWPTFFKRVGIYDVNVKYMKRQDMIKYLNQLIPNDTRDNQELLGRAIGHKHEIVICTEEAKSWQEVGVDPIRPPLDLFQVLAHEYFHLFLEQHGMDDNEIIVDLFANAFTNFIQDCGFEFPPVPKGKKK